MNHIRDYYTEVLLQQILNEIEETKEKHYHIEFHDETMREVNRFKIRNFLSNKCNQKVEELTTDIKNRFSFKVKAVFQLLILKSLKTFPVKLVFTNF